MAILVQSNKKPSVSFPEQTGAIVTFNSQYAGLPLKSCKVNIPVTQEGTGDPSPDNVRNFVGITSLDFTANSVVRTFQFGQIIYGIENGDIIAGSFPIPVYPLNEFSSIRIYNGSTLTNTQTFYLFLEDVQRQADLFILSNIFKQKALSSDEPYCVEISRSSSLKQRIYVSFPVGTTTEQAREYLTNNNVIFLIHLATPEVINLGGMNISLLQGENNIWADTGETTVQYIKIGG